MARPLEARSSTAAPLTGPSPPHFPEHAKPKRVQSLTAGGCRRAGGKHPLFDEEDGSYHGLRWGHDLPETLKPIAFILRLRTVLNSD